MFADIRGYTTYTAARGADAAARLASRFTALSGDVIEAHDGTVRGRWGDEVLAEFTSARAAVRAAVELQSRCVAETLDGGPPLAVGIGLDIGEPVQGEASRSAQALNIASRLCSAAGPSQTLASRELAHLAGIVDGATYVEHDPLRLKGVSGRTPVVLVRPTELDSATLARFRRTLISEPQAMRARRRRRALLVGTLCLALVVGIGTLVLVRRGPPPAPIIAGNGLGVIDPGSGELLADIPAGQSPSGVAEGAGSIWVTNTADNTLSRIDEASRTKVDDIRVGSAPVAAAVLGDFVWVVNSGDGTVWKIATANNQVVQRVPVGSEPDAIAVSAGSGGSYVWVANRGDATVSRIDPTGASPVQPFGVGDSPDGLAYRDGSLWVANGADGTVYRLDLTTRTTTQFNVGNGPRGILVTRDGVWVANSLDQTVSRIDPTGNSGVRTFGVGDTPTGLASVGSSVWVSVAAAANVVEIDPGADRAVRTLYVGSSPRGLAVAGGLLWVTAQPFAAASHRGGTLTISGSFSDIDPTQASNTPDLEALPLVFDGLVAVNRAEGAAGYELVPDLAETLPRPSPDGKSYTFTLRPGIRYSNGRTVVADDVRLGIERAFRTGGAGSYFARIVGASACNQSRCDLRAGIVTHNSSRTITFLLTAPDPDFLGELSLLAASVAAPGSPMTYKTDPVTKNPIEPLLVGTGPYMLLKADKPAPPGDDPEQTMVRNPYFRQWSAAAQPAGYPDKVRWVNLAGDDSTAILSGKVDISDYSHSGAPLPQLAQWLSTYPTQVKTDISAASQYLTLNSSTAPFNNPLARQAVAWAVNRTVLAALHGPGPASCQLVPPDYPAYPNTCPYANGPNPIKAAQLVTQSGTRNDPVQIVLPHGPAYDPLARYLATTLADIGYTHVTTKRLHIVTQGCLSKTVYDCYFGYTAQPHTQMSITANVWSPDFPSPSQFYVLVSCASDIPSPGNYNGVNQSHFCDPTTDRIAAAALAQQGAGGDPAQAVKLWRTVNARVDALAPTVGSSIDDWVVLISPRVRNYHVNPLRGPMLDQMWVH